MSDAGGASGTAGSSVSNKEELAGTAATQLKIGPRESDTAATQEIYDTPLILVILKWLMSLEIQPFMIPKN